MAGAGAMYARARRSSQFQFGSREKRKEYPELPIAPLGKIYGGPLKCGLRAAVCAPNPMEPLSIFTKPSYARGGRSKLKEAVCAQANRHNCSVTGRAYNRVLLLHSERYGVMTKPPVSPARRQPPAMVDDHASVANLQFDPENPRMPMMRFDGEEDAVKFMLANYDVDELVRSILVTGWLDFEPLIVEAGTMFVLEGNRRLAALKLIGSATLREAVGYVLPNIGDAKPAPLDIRVRIVPDRKTARAYIGFKHVNGPVKWDAYAKARFAVEWLNDQGSLTDVSRALGDNHNTVRRLVDGWRVLEQATSWGFDIEKRAATRFYFSHLYTAIARPSARTFLGLTDDMSDVLPANPVPKEKRPELIQFMTWLYGQGEIAPVLRSQNPDLNHILEVLSSKAATANLQRFQDLGRAHEEVVPKNTRFAEALYDAIRSAEKAAGLHASYDGDTVHLEAAQNLFLTVRGLRDNMRTTAEGEQD